MSRRDEIIRQVKSIPELPSTVVQILKLMQDEDFNISELQKLIEHSPSLAANILRIANSAYYAGPKSIASVREAVVRLGSKVVRDFALATAVAPLASREVRGYQLSPGALWEHSVTTAMATENLAQELGVKLENYVFTASLLHDLGKVVLGNAIEVDIDLILEIAYVEGKPFETAEREVLDIDHAEVGAELLKSWNIPDEIVNIVRWHHDPDGSPDPDEMLDLVHIANHLVILSDQSRGRDGLNYRPSSGVIKRICLTNKVMEKILLETFYNLDDVRPLFELAGLKEN